MKNLLIGLLLVIFQPLAHAEPLTPHQLIFVTEIVMRHALELGAKTHQCGMKEAAGQITDGATKLLRNLGWNDQPNALAQLWERTSTWADNHIRYPMANVDCKATKADAEEYVQASLGTSLLKDPTNTTK